MTKFRITFKDPDGVYEDIRDEVQRQLEPFDTRLDEEEIDTLADERTASLHQFLETWIRFQEYITIEFDTEAKTATVVKNA